MTSKKRLFEKKEIELAKRIANVEEKTQDEVREVMKSAMNKAGEILKETEVLKENMEAKYAEQIEQAAKNNLSLFEKGLEKTLEKSQLEIDNSNGKIKELMENYLKEETAKELDKVKQELASYKQEKMKGLDTSINQIVENAVVDAIGKGVSLNDHERIVSLALEKAKTDKLFE